MNLGQQFEVGQTRWGNPVSSPAVDGRDRGLDHPCDDCRPAKSVDDFGCMGAHARDHAIIAIKSQPQNCDNRFCDNRTVGRQWGMTPKQIQERMDRLGIKSADLAAAIGISADKLSKVFSGVRQWRGRELISAIEFLDRVDSGDGVPDHLPSDGQRDYLPVEILPTFAGMGGGGTGDGDQEYGLVPRRLIEDELRATPADFLLIDTRGDSMEPDFHHGDQILIDKRDTNPVQPGYFAIWDGDGYVLKNVERTREGLRIFSSNGKYREYLADADEVRIMGRPVWFARRL